MFIKLYSTQHQRHHWFPFLSLHFFIIKIYSTKHQLHHCFLFLSLLFLLIKLYSSLHHSHHCFHFRRSVFEKKLHSTQHNSHHCGHLYGSSPHQPIVLSFLSLPFLEIKLCSIQQQRQNCFPFLIFPFS